MSQIAMQPEDYIAQLKAENAAQREQIDNLVAAVISRDKENAELKEQNERLRSSVDEFCRLQRRREEAAKADIERQEREAGLL